METLRPVFAIDHRSVRLFRILLGAGLILQAYFLSLAVSDFFTDTGVFPRDLVFQLRGQPLRMSPLNLFGGAWWPQLWLLLLAACGAFIVAHKFTRVASVISFLILQFFIIRNPFVIYGSDKLLQLLCFWSIFLPPGRKSGDKEFSFSNGISAAVLLQIVLLYAVAGFAKASSVWWTEPAASYLALQGDAFARPFGKYLTQFTGFLEIGTRIVFVLERFGWIFLFVTAQSGLWRLLIVLGFGTMHIMFGFCLNLNMFPYVDIVLLSVALPSLFWDKLQAWMPALRVPTWNERSSSFGGLWSLVSEPLAMAAIASMAFVAVNSMPRRPLRVNKGFDQVSKAIGIHQAWDLFAPYPYLDDGWFMFIGKDRAGTPTDLLTGKQGAIDFSQPGFVGGRHANYRWTPYLFQWRNPQEKIDQRLAEFFCETSSTKDGDRYSEVQVFFVSDPTVLPTQRSKIGSTLRKSLKCDSTRNSNVVSGR